MIGCYNLGVLYDHERNMKHDYIKAKEFYRKAYDTGIENGCKKYMILNQ